MKKILYLFPIVLLFACVSSKKFHALSDEKMELSEKYNALNSKYQEEITKGKYSEQTISKNQRDIDDLADKSSKLEQDKKQLYSEREKLGEKAALLAQELAKIKEELKKIEGANNALVSDLKRSLSGEVYSGIDYQIKGGKVYLIMPNKLLYPSGKAEVSPLGKEALALISNVLIENKVLNIEIEGHTDNVPIATTTYKDNWDLSTARATNVIRLLVEAGLPNEKLSAVGMGQFHPVADNATPEGKQLNRRTEIILSPDLEKLYSRLYSN